MTRDSVNEFPTLIQQEINFLETQKEHLFKADSLIKAALGDCNFNHLPKIVIHGYFCALDDIVENAIHLNDTSIDLLQRGMHQEMV